MVLFRVPHQVIGRRPIAMTVEQRADNAAIQDPGKRFVFLLWFPFCNDFAVLRKTANTQSFGIRWAAAPTRIVRGIAFLQGLIAHRVLQN